MTHDEAVLRKELALAHIRIARAELALARVQGSDSLAVVDSAMDLASTVISRPGYGKWSQYALLALSVAHVALGVRRAI